VIVRTNTGIEVSVHRTDRVRSADLFVEASTVRLVVPKRLSDQQIERIVKAKTVWIGKKLRLNSAVVVPKKKEFISGETVQYLGKNYRLKVIVGEVNTVKMRGGRIEICIAKSRKDRQSDALVRQLLISWFRERAIERLSEKVAKFSKQLSVTVDSLGIRDFKSRWGSCIAPNKVVFNWRIMMAPHHVIDYVVAHELCHLRHHDHSSRFWNNLRRVALDVKKSQSWLQSHSMALKMV